MRHRMTFSNCLSTRQSFLRKKKRTHDLLSAEFPHLKIFTCMHALNFRHNYMILNTKYKIQKGTKMYNCVMFYELFSKGEFLSAIIPKEAPFSPTPLPPESESDKMAYIWLTDYVVNTAGLVYQEAGILNETVTPSMVS